MENPIVNPLQKKIDDLTINGQTTFDRVSEEYDRVLNDYISVIEQILENEVITPDKLAEYEEELLAEDSPHKANSLYPQFLDLRAKKQQASENLDYNPQETTFAQFALLNEPHPFIEAVKKLTEIVGNMKRISANEIRGNLTTSPLAYEHLLYYKELLNLTMYVSTEAAEALLIVPELEELLKPEEDTSKQKLLPPKAGNYTPKE